MGEEHPHDPMYGVKLEQIVNVYNMWHKEGEPPDREEEPKKDGSAECLDEDGETTWDE